MILCLFDSTVLLSYQKNVRAFMKGFCNKNILQHNSNSDSKCKNLLSYEELEFY